MSTRSRLVISLLSLTFLATVSCTSIVMKPEVHSVKKVAILSVYANDKVSEKKGRGFVKGWKPEFKMQVAEDILQTHSNKLTELGFKVVDSQEILASDAYKKAFEVKPVTKNETVNRAVAFIGNLAKDAHRARFFAPSGMHPIVFQEDNSNCYGNACETPPQEKLAEFAKKLNVDAVAVVQVDFCYEGGTFTSLGGAGEAFMTAATSVKMVNRSGDVVVNMPIVPMCGKADNRAESKNSMLMNGGDLVFISASASKLRNMFSQSSKQSAELAYAEISKAMN